jgi:hypothetical protein
LQDSNIWKTYSSAFLGSTFETNATINDIVHGNVFYPNMSDSTGQKEDITYMKNRAMSKSAVNIKIGLGNTSADP